jgi:hypothetical protein
MILIVETIANVAQSLFGIRSSFVNAKRERKDRIAALFEAISKCLYEVSAKLRIDEVPHGKCAELGAYANELKTAIGDEVGTEKAASLSNDLHSAHDVELLLSQFDSNASKENNIADLEKSAGVFQALSALTKAST